LTTVNEEAMPNEVILAFNELIAKHWVCFQAQFTQADAATLIAEKMRCPRHEVYQNGWLHIEGIYHRAGWDVIVDRPGYLETYPTTYTFREAPIRCRVTRKRP
jgi:hypothetical protein